MEKLTAAPQGELFTVEGGQSKGDPCEAKAFHGFNGTEQEVVTKIADWIFQQGAQ